MVTLDWTVKVFGSAGNATCLNDGAKHAQVGEIHGHLSWRLNPSDLIIFLAEYPLLRFGIGQDFGLDHHFGITALHLQGRITNRLILIASQCI